MAELTEMPKGKELEEFVAAHFQCAGYYVEKNIIEQDINQVLELDVVATDYSKLPSDRVLLEIKSGSWGFHDLFKVCGWMRYLEIDKGIFVISNVSDGKYLEFVRKKMSKLNLPIVYIDDFGQTAEAFNELGIPLNCDAMMLDIWRFSYWIERKMIERLRHESKSNPDQQGPTQAQDYYDLVNDGLFFMAGEWLRVNRLYQAYQSHPKLTLATSSEMSGGGYDPENPKDGGILKEALYSAKHPLLQICMYLEHRARISVLRSAVDYLDRSDKTKTDEDEEGEDAIDWEIQVLPNAFLGAIDWLEQQPNFRLYPYFWQVFLWGFGGFYLRDREDKEFDLLSSKTGIPIDEIPTALSVYDRLFPMPDSSWFAENPYSQCRVIKMVPAYFQGLGAYLRLGFYAVEKYQDLGYGDYTIKDLIKWHNAAVNFLEEGR